MKLLYTLLILFFIVQFANSQNLYEKALTALHIGEIEEAEELLIKATNNSKHKEKANLLLCLMTAYSGDSKKGAEFFKSYLTAIANPSPAALSLYNHGMVFGSNYGRLPFQLDLLKTLESKKSKDSSIDPHLDFLLAKHYKITKMPELSKAYFEKVNQLKNWQIVGPFSNKMNSGYNKDFGVLKGPNPEAKFHSTFGAEIGWEIPEIQISEGFLCQANYLVGKSNILYAQTFIESKEDQDLILSFGYSGSLKLWVNDALVHYHESELNTKAGYHNYRVKFNKGNNRLLVQLGQFELNEPQFNFRLLSEDWSLAEITSTATFKPYVIDNAANGGVLIPNSLEQSLILGVQEAVETDYVPALLLASHYKNIRIRDEAQAIYVELLEKYPKDFLVLIEAIKYYKDINDESERSRLYQELKKYHPDCFEVISSEIQKSLETQDKASAKEYLKTWNSKRRPEIVSKAFKMYEYLIEENIDGAIAIMDELAREMEPSDDLSLANYKFKVGIKGQKVEGLKYLEEVLDNQFSETIAYTLADAYFQQGRSEEGVNLLLDYAKKVEVPIGFQQKLINQYTKLSRYDDAISIAKAILVNRPSDYHTLSDLGYLHRQNKDIKQAEFYYNEVLKYYPFDSSIHEKIRELKGEKSIDEILGKVDITAEIKEYELDFQSEIRKPYDIVCMKTTGFVFNSLAKAYNYVGIFKVVDETGIEDLQLFNFEGSENFKSIINETYTVKASGQKINGERNGSEVVYKNLEIGDFVYFNYTMRQTSGEKHHTFFSDNFEFNNYYPNFKREYTLYVEPEVTIKDTVLNGDVQKDVTDFAGFKRYNWTVINPAPLKDEPFSPKFADIATVLHISNGTNWKQIADWYQDLTEAQIKPDAIIKKLAKEIVGEKDISQKEKAKLIYDFVCKNIQYSSIDFRQSGLIPQKASDVYTSRLGDCKDVSALFTAIAREAGLDVEMVLINTSDNGEREMLFPSINFNHCIVKVNLDNEAKYLELTDSFLPFGYLNSFHQGSSILDIPYKLVNINPQLASLNFKNANPAIIKKHSRVEIEHDGVVKIEGNELLSGVAASSITSNYLNLDAMERKVNLNTTLDEFFESDINIDSLWFGTLEMLKDTVQYNYKLSVKNGLNKLGSFKSFKIPFTDVLVSNFLLQDTPRKYDFDFYNYETIDRYEHKIVLTVPQQLKFVEIPSNQSYSFLGLKYELQFSKINDRTLEIDRIYDVQRRKMTPSEFEDFKPFVEKVIEAENTFLLLK